MPIRIACRLGAAALIVGLSGLGRAAEPAAKAPAASIPIAEFKRDKPVDFMTEIVPIFRKNCLACHNATDAKADLILETPAAILKGGETGPSVVPGKGAESLLLKVASHQAKPFMPPKSNKVDANPLTPMELGLLKGWIDQGATGVVSVALGPIAWQPLPAGFNPINSVAVTPDGQYAACGRANQIFIYHVPSGQFVTRLTDPDLLKSGVFDKPGVADRDIIQSLAFNPEGNMLASGSYRVAKLWRLQAPAPRLNISLTPSDSVKCLAASPDGKLFATADREGSIRVWEVASGAHLRTVAGRGSAVQALQFSPDGKKLVWGGSDKSARILNLATGAEEARIITGAEVTALAWLANGTQIATGGSDNQIRVWKAPFDGTGAPKVLSGHSKPVVALETLPGAATQLLSGGADGTVRLWNAESGQIIRQMDHGASVTAIAVRPDGKRFASAGANKIVKLWNAENGQLVSDLKGDRQAQEFAAQMERGLTFAKSEVGYHKSSIDNAEKQQKAEAEAVKKATDAKAAAEKALAEKLEASKKARDAKAAADKALADATNAVKAGGEKKAAAEKAVAAAEAEAKAAAEKVAAAQAAFDKASQAKSAPFMAVIEASAGVKAAMDKVTAARTAADKDPKNKALLDAKAAAEKEFADKSAAAEKAIEQSSSAKALAEKAAQDKAAAAKLAADAAAKVKAGVDAKAAAEKAFADSTNQQKDLDGKAKAADKAAADADTAIKQAETAKANTEQNLALATASSQKADATTAAAKLAMQAAEVVQKKAEADLDLAKKRSAETERATVSLAFSKDNLTLALGGEDREIRSYNAENGRAYHKLSAHTAPVTALAFLPGGNLLSAGDDRVARVWDVNPSWVLERKLGNGEENSSLADRVLALDFSPDGKWLATGGGVPSRSGEIKIWDVTDGSLVRELKDPHSDSVFSLNFSADKKYLASGAADKFLKIFDVATGKHVKSFEGHTHHVLGVSWRLDGRGVASAGADKVVKVWDFVTGEQKKTIEGFSKEVTSIHFIGGSNEALVSSGDTQVRIVREDGNNVRTFGGSTDYMEASAISADAKVVVAGGQESVLRVWNGVSGDVIATFPAPKPEDLAKLANAGQ